MVGLMHVEKCIKLDIIQSCSVSISLSVTLTISIHKCNAKLITNNNSCKGYIAILTHMFSNLNSIQILKDGDMKQLLK